MGTLLKNNIKNLLQTKLLYLSLLFAFVFHFIVIKGVDTAVVTVNEVEQFIGPDRVLHIMFVVQMGVGGFVSMIYGVWIAPYLHQGERLPLTFTLPVAKWKYAIGYAIAFLILIFALNTMMFSLHGIIYGYEDYQERGFPATGLLMCNVYEILVLQVGMFGFAIFSLAWGKMAALFAGFILFFLTQVCGLFFATDFGNALRGESPVIQGIYYIYKVMPPWDRVFVQMGDQIAKGTFNDSGPLVWVLWLLLLMFLFTLQLRFPKTRRQSE